MDDADRASEQEEYFRNESLWKVKQNSKLKPWGKCYNCAELLTDKSLLFCDVGCRRDWERRQSGLRYTLLSPLERRLHREREEADGEEQAQSRPSHGPGELDSQAYRGNKYKD